MIHKKLLSLLVLLMTAASGAWADYTVTWRGNTLKGIAVNKAYAIPISAPSETTVKGITLTANVGFFFYKSTGANPSVNLTSGAPDGLVFSAETNIKSIEFTFNESGCFNGTVAATPGTGGYTLTTPAKSFGIPRNDWAYDITKVVFTLEGEDPNPNEVDLDFNNAMTEAEFEMPANDVTVDYELVRDMSVSVSAAMANRVRIQEVENKFQPVVATQINPEVKDNLNTQSPVTMTVTTDYSLQLQKKDENDVWTDVTDLSVGTFRYMVTGTGLYDGIAYTNEFQLFEGYSVEVPAGEYATFYAEDKVKIDESTTGGQLYTITSVNVTDAKATATELTVAAAQTPLLVYNSGSEKKTFLLIPTDDAATSVTAASQFVGTLEATTIAASTSTLNNYAFNGKQFVWVKNAISVGANKCWLQIGTVPAGTRSISIVFGDGTTGIESIDNGQLTIDNWYDLNGRKLQGMPTKKGLYIMNGKKVVVK